MIHKHKNNSQSNWALVNKLFPIAYERWERFRKSADGCYMNWTRDRCKGAKTHVKFCSNDTEESHSCIVSSLGMKSGFFLRIPSAKVMGSPKCKKSGAPSTSTARPNHFGRKTMLCVWWDQKNVVYYELLKPGETLSTTMIDLNRSLLKKRSEYQKRQHKIIFLHDPNTYTYGKTRDTLEVLSWEVLPHAVYSPDLVPSNYHLFASMSHALAEQHFGFVWRCEKMARWMVRDKRRRFLLAWYSQIARKMGKMCN